MKKIKIQYLNDDIKRLEYIDGKSDWIDLRAAEDIVLKKDEFRLIPLGVAMQLPEDMKHTSCLAVLRTKISASSRRTIWGS